MKQFPVAVIMEMTRLDNRWVSEKWEAIGVVPAFAADPAASAPRRIVAEARSRAVPGRVFPARVVSRRS